MTLSSDFSELQRASVLVAEIARGLVDEKQRMQTEVDALVTSGWVGQAADQYAAAWGDWVDAADRVLAALHAESELIDRHRTDLMATDDGVVGRAAHLHSRLGQA